jgi:hypothetical protein
MPWSSPVLAISVYSVTVEGCSAWRRLLTELWYSVLRNFRKYSLSDTACSLILNAAMISNLAVRPVYHSHWCNFMSACVLCWVHSFARIMGQTLYIAVHLICTSFQVLATLSSPVEFFSVTGLNSIYCPEWWGCKLQCAHRCIRPRLVYRGRQHVKKRRSVQCTEADIKGLRVLSVTWDCLRLN